MVPVLVLMHVLLLICWFRPLDTGLFGIMSLYEPHHGKRAVIGCNESLRTGVNYFSVINQKQTTVYYISYAHPHSTHNVF